MLWLRLHSYKVPLDQVAAAYVTLTKHGMDAADANTQLADQFLRLTTVTPKVATELERVSKLTGIDLVGDFTTAGLASKGLTGIYADLSAAEQKMGLSSEAANAENMLLGDSLRGGRGLMIDVAYQTNDYLPILSSLDDKTASATKRQDDFNRALETTGGQFAVLKANASAAAVTVGGPVNEAFGGLLGVVNQTIRMAEAWNGTIVAMGEAWVTGAPLGQAWSDQMERIGGTTAKATIPVEEMIGVQQQLAAELGRTSTALQDEAAAMAAVASASNYGPSVNPGNDPNYRYTRPDLSTDAGVAYVEAQAKEGGPGGRRRRHCCQGATEDEL